MLSDVGGTINDIIGVTQIGGFGYTGSNSMVVSFDADNIFLNVEGLDVEPGFNAQFRIDVPAPAPLALLAMGLGLLGARRFLRS